jgi:hypothetical protein
MSPNLSASYLDMKMMVASVATMTAEIFSQPRRMEKMEVIRT